MIASTRPVHGECPDAQLPWRVFPGRMVSGNDQRVSLFIGGNGDVIIAPEEEGLRAFPFSSFSFSEHRLALPPDSWL